MQLIADVTIESMQLNILGFLSINTPRFVSLSDSLYRVLFIVLHW